jgi:hypothetical protein
MTSFDSRLTIALATAAGPKSMYLASVHKALSLMDCDSKACNKHGKA